MEDGAAQCVSRYSALGDTMCRRRKHATKAGTDGKIQQFLGDMLAEGCAAGTEPPRVGSPVPFLTRTCYLMTAIG